MPSAVVAMLETLRVSFRSRAALQVEIWLFAINSKCSSAPGHDSSA